jgi:hypothetical protein
MIYFQGSDLVVGNLGDSRAIMGTRDAFNNLTAVQLTVDLKPNLPSTFISHFDHCNGCPCPWISNFCPLNDSFVSVS